MTNTGFFIYTVLFLMTVALGFYNVIFAKEVHRIEKSIGITLPSFIHSFLKGITLASALLVGVTLLMAVITFFIPTS
jgi:hypothetical protein